jgi:hypothetical protein
VFDLYLGTVNDVASRVVQFILIKNWFLVSCHFPRLLFSESLLFSNSDFYYDSSNVLSFKNERNSEPIYEYLLMGHCNKCSIESDPKRDLDLVLE